LLPYLPVSLGLVKECLEAMSDDAAVSSTIRDEITVYDFAAYADAEKTGGVLAVEGCVACDKAVTGAGGDTLCGTCRERVDRDLKKLAERTGWPAQAVYEHEILYHAAAGDGPVFAESLASASRYTLRRMQQKLERLTIEGYIRQEPDTSRGIMRYRFPELDYPGTLYRRNMESIRRHPASVMEEVQIKVVRILITLGFMFLAMLLLAFWGFPFPLLLLLLLVAGPAASLFIWFKRDKPEEDIPT
jgi:hypothetical protein